MTRPRIKVIQKVAEVLGAFDSRKSIWRLNELQKRLDWDKATMYRFLEALVAIDILERDQEGRYSLGRLNLELAAVYLSTNPLRRELMRHAAEIAETTGLTTQVALLDGKAAAIVGSFEGNQPIRAAAMLGERIALHASAAGKAILSELSESALDELLPEKFERFTANTVTTRLELLEELEEVRRDGLARARSELADGLFAVAVAIPQGIFTTTPAALTCVGPDPSLAPASWEDAEDALRRVKPYFVLETLVS